MGAVKRQMMAMESVELLARRITQIERDIAEIRQRVPRGFGEKLDGVVERVDQIPMDFFEKVNDLAVSVSYIERAVNEIRGAVTNIETMGMEEAAGRPSVPRGRAS